MNLPVIDIPVQLPFEVPVMVHPVFVHFAIAIPVIVFLLEIANIKARNRAVSVTSLFLMTLGVLVYAGAFFSGKADGSHAWSMLSPEAQEELKFHKLLGTYLVYAMGALFLLKILAMLVKRPWARDMFIAFLLVFIGVMYKQGKDGGELVYEYGVNVAPVMHAQPGGETESEATETTGESAPAVEAHEEQNAPAVHESAEPQTHEATEAAEPAAEATHEEASGEAAETTETGEATHENATENATEEATESGDESAESAHETGEGSSGTEGENATHAETPAH